MDRLLSASDRPTPLRSELLRRLRALSAAAAVTAVALVVSGCGGGSSDSGSSGGGGPQSATQNEINPVDRDQLTQGGSFRWALAEMPPNFNYNQLDGALDDNEDVISALMPAAFDFSADATPTVNKDYFSDIELT